MRDAPVLGAVLFLMLLAFGLWVGYARYRECRAHGFSVFYCATQR